MTETLQQDDPAAMPARTFGKLARSMAGYTLVTALMFVSPLFVFIPASLLHCGIRIGRRAAWLLLVLSFAAAALFLYPGAASGKAVEAAWTYGFLLGLFLAIALPALAILPMVERGEKFGRVLLYAIVISIAGLGVTELTMRIAANGFSIYAAQVALVREQMAVTASIIVKAGGSVAGFGFFQTWAERCVTASAVNAAAMTFVFSLIMFGRLRAWREFVLRRTPDAIIANPYRFRNLSLPEWLLFAFVIGGLSPLASGVLQQIGANILLTVAFLYLLQGLALFRSFLAAVGAGAIASLFAWMILALLFLGGIAPLLLCIAGLFDSFFDFRHFNRKDHSDESHSH
jgi:hypothetical protein